MRTPVHDRKNRISAAVCRADDTIQLLKTGVEIVERVTGQHGLRAHEEAQGFRK